MKPDEIPQSVSEIGKKRSGLSPEETKKHHLKTQYPEGGKQGVTAILEAKRKFKKILQGVYILLFKFYY